MVKLTFKGKNLQKFIYLLICKIPFTYKVKLIVLKKILHF